MQTFKKKNIILILFFASGISGLIYEVVWLRILSRITGVTTYATAITLAAFMAGLAIGSLLFGKLIDRRNDSLRIYAFLQFMIACIALAMPSLFKAFLPFYKHVYEMSGYNPNLIISVRASVCFLLLLIPTTIMGGTLPVLTSFIVKKEGVFGKNFSMLYGVNTFGAVLGVLLGGFITIGAFGEWNTTLLGAAINLIVGIIAFQLYIERPSYAGEEKFSAAKPETVPDTRISPYADRVRQIVLIAIMLSGFTSLAYEVIWSRQLILFLDTSIYAFSSMLAVFLTGIAAGSLFMNRFVDKLKAPLALFATLEFSVGILSLVNLYLFQPLDNSPLTKLSAPLILVFPLTFLFGMIFPVAALCYAKSVNRAGSSVGTLYSFNTVGNVTGSLFTGFFFISIFGSSKTIIILSLLNISLGFLLLWFESRKSTGFKLIYLTLVPVVVLLCLGFKGKDPFLDVIEKRIKKGAQSYTIFHNQESVEGTITGYVRDGHKYLLINGVGQTHLGTETKLMAHVPILLAENPKDMLIICFGMGTTLRSACVYDQLKITVVELVPELFGLFKYYHDNAEEILKRKNLNLTIDDGRNFLLLSPKKYDVITVDPSPPIHSAGTVNLYSREFLLLCKEHLAEGGTMCLWFPSGAVDVGHTGTEVLAMLKTFHSVFPDMSVWSGPGGWGIYMIGTLTPIEIDKSKIEKAFQDATLVADLSEFVNFTVTSSHFTDLLMFGNETVEKLTKGSPIITDDYPYTEFPLWRSLFSETRLRRYR